MALEIEIDLKLWNRQKVTVKENGVVVKVFKTKPEKYRELVPMIIDKYNKRRNDGNQESI